MSCMAGRFSPPLGLAPGVGLASSLFFRATWFSISNAGTGGYCSHQSSSLYGAKTMTSCTIYYLAAVCRSSFRPRRRSSTGQGAVDAVQPMCSRLGPKSDLSLCLGALDSILLPSGIVTSSPQSGIAVGVPVAGKLFDVSSDEEIPPVVVLPAVWHCHAFQCDRNIREYSRRISGFGHCFI